MNWKSIFATRFLCLSLSQAGELLLIPCERKHDLRASTTETQQWISLVENGRGGGKCFHVRCPADRKSVLFHPWTHPQVRVGSASDEVRVSIWVKGKGGGNLGFLSYTAASAIFYPGGTSRKFAVDTAGQWERLEMRYIPKAGSDYANRVHQIMPFISIVSSSDLHIDDFELELISPPTRITIED